MHLPLPLFVLSAPESAKTWLEISCPPPRCGEVLRAAGRAETCEEMHANKNTSRGKAASQEVRRR